MGGREGIRGYQIQSLVCVLDSLDLSHDWLSVSVEPLSDSEKVDIAWQYLGRRRVVQVKSSERQINLPDARRWAHELEVSTSAEEYELRLLGPCSAEVSSATHIGKVRLSTPEPENVPALLERAAHKLNLYLHAKEITLPPKTLELVVGALCNQLLTQAIGGATWERADLHSTISDWMSAILSRLPVEEVPLPQPRNTFFWGRDELLATICNEFKRFDEENRPAIQALSGLGGVGKTQIALEFAYRNKSSYAHILFVDADSNASLSAGFASLARQLSLPESASGDQQVAVQGLRRWLGANDRWLFIFDNADYPDNLVPFLVQRPSCHTLITSRASVLDMIGIGSPHVVSSMTDEESLGFLLARTGRNDAAEHERSVAGQIGVELGGLPLALEQAGAYITSRQMTFTAYLSAFQIRRLELLERKKPVTGAYASTVATTWSLNIEAVKDDSPASAELLRWSAFFYPNRIPLDFIVARACDFSNDIAVALKGVLDDGDVTRIDELLFPLTRFSLINKDADDASFSVHRLIQEVIRSHMDDEAVIAHRLQLIRSLSLAFPIVAFEVWIWCERLLPHAVTLLASASEQELFSEEAGTLLHRCAHFLEETGDYRLAASIYSKAVEVRQRVLGSQHADLGTSINNFGLTLHKLGYYANAECEYRKALIIRSVARGKDDPDVAQTYNNLGLTLVEQGRFDEAESAYLNAKAILTEAGDENELTLAICMNNIAGLLHKRGRHDEAEAMLRQVVVVKKAGLGEFHPEVAHAMKNVAHLVLERGATDEAMEILANAMSIESQTIGTRHPTFGQSLNAFGVMLAQKGRFAEAEGAYKDACNIFMATSGERHPGIGMVYVNAGHLYMEQGLFDKALEFNWKAIKHLSETEGPEHLLTATAINNTAYCYLRTGDGVEAKNLYERALSIRVKILGRCHIDVATVLGNLAMIEARLGSHSEAAAKYAEAFSIIESLGFPRINDCVALMQNYLTFQRDSGVEIDSAKVQACLNALIDRSSC